MASALRVLIADVFETDDEGGVQWRLQRLPDPSLALAEDDQGLVGFKFGHALSPERYQSWLGGVAPPAGWESCR